MGCGYDIDSDQNLYFYINNSVFQQKLQMVYFKNIFFPTFFLDKRNIRYKKQVIKIDEFRNYRIVPWKLSLS